MDRGLFSPAPARVCWKSEVLRIWQTRPRFYIEQRLLRQPDSLQHYLNEPMPDNLAPLHWLGVTDDLTDESRVDEDGVSHVPTFAGQVPYFYAANQVDPRAGIRSRRGSLSAAGTVLAAPSDYYDSIVE